MEELLLDRLSHVLAESSQNLIANIRRRSGCGVVADSICHRPLYALVYRGCQKGVNGPLFRPADHDSLAPDLSAVIDCPGEDCVEVGITRNQSVEVGHNPVLPDEGMVPVEIGVPVTSHYLALVVNAVGFAAKISRKKAEAGERAVRPNRAILSSVVRTADGPSNYAWVVNANGERAGSVVRKGGEGVVFPRCGINRGIAAG